LAVTFAEWRDRRKILDIEHFTQQPLASEMIPGLEPTQRAPRAPSHEPRRGAAKPGFGGKPGAGRGFAGPKRGSSFKPRSGPRP
jgi:hypothetical protein